MTVKTDDSGLPADGDLLFAYGTLQRGGEYHHLLTGSHAEFIATARLITAYPLLIADYPCLIDAPGTGYRVEGEVFRIPERRQWEALDRLEGYPEEYTRRVEKVETANGIVPAWTYFYIRGDLDPRKLEPVPRFIIP